MENQYDDYISKEQKNKTIVIILWLCVALMTSVEFLDYIIYQFVDYSFVIENFFFSFIIVPLCINLTVATITTFLYRCFNKKYPQLTSYIVMIGFLTFIHGVIIIHYGVSVIYMAYSLAIFISILFIDKYLTTLIAAISLILYIPLYLFYLPLQLDYTYKHDYIDATATIVFVTGCYISSIFIMKFFEDLMVKIADVSLLSADLKKKVQLDSFTKLYNRNCFDNTLDSYFQKNQFEKITFSILILDIDNFKRINDTYGHKIGDEVILELVRVINENKRETDKAFRYGGDEFAIILETDKKNAFLVAEKIRTSFHNISIENIKNELFSISIGLCEYNKEFSSVAQYFIKVDNALYRAKQTGKNKTVIANTQNYMENC